jgi:hypothetical protein
MREGKGQTMMVVTGAIKAKIASADDVLGLFSQRMAGEQHRFKTKMTPVEGKKADLINANAIIANFDMVGGDIVREGKAKPKLTLYYTEKGGKFMLIVAICWVKESGDPLSPESDPETVGLFYQQKK